MMLIKLAVMTNLAFLYISLTVQVNTHSTRYVESRKLVTSLLALCWIRDVHYMIGSFALHECDEFPYRSKTYTMIWQASSKLVQWCINDPDSRTTGEAKS